MVSHHLKHSPQNYFCSEVIISHIWKIVHWQMIHSSKKASFQICIKGHGSAEQCTPGEAMWQGPETLTLLTHLYHCQHTKAELIPSMAPHDLLIKSRKEWFGWENLAWLQPVIINMLCPYINLFPSLILSVSVNWEEQNLDSKESSSSTLSNSSFSPTDLCNPGPHSF